MCNSPIEIYNKKLFLTRYDKVKHTVPCGKCWSCMRQKQDDYFVKAYYLYMLYRDNNGFAYFDTLTFNDDCLPTDELGNPCFSLEILREFRLALYFTIEKYLLKHYKFDESIMTREQRVEYLKKHNVDVKNLKISNRVRSLSWTEKKYIIHAIMRDNLDYLITSEFGHKKHRPHYHILFFCSISCLSFWQIARWIKICWSFGFTDSRYKVRDRVVGAPWTKFSNQFDRAIGYVTKYVTKDLLNYKNYSPDCDDAKQRVISSHGFDRGVMSLLNDSVIENGFNIFRSKAQKYRTYSVPLSCVNKYLYNREKVDLSDDKLHYTRHFKNDSLRDLYLKLYDNKFWLYITHIRDLIANGASLGFDTEKYQDISLHIDLFQYCYESYHYKGRFRYAAGFADKFVIDSDSHTTVLNRFYDDDFFVRSAARENATADMFRYSDALFYAMDKLVDDAHQYINENKDKYFELLEKAKESIINNTLN